MTNEEIRERLLAIQGSLDAAAGDIPMAAHGLLSELRHALESEPEPLAVVRGYVQLGEVEDAVEHPDFDWCIVVDPDAQVCEGDEPGTAVTVTFTERHET